MNMRAIVSSGRNFDKIQLLSKHFVTRDQPLSTTRAEVLHPNVNRCQQKQGQPVAY